MIRAKFLLGALLSIAIALPAGVQAASVGAPSLGGSVEVVGMVTKNFNYNVMSNVVMDTGDGATYRFMGGDLAGLWDYSWNILANADPFIDSTFTIVNVTPGALTFNVVFGLPVSPAFSPGLKSGLLGFSFSDANLDGSASVVLNSWDGLIDGSSALTLFTASVPCTGVGCTGSVSPVTAGPLLHAPGVSTDIGNIVNFTLSAGDSITMRTRFEVVPVPLPAGAWLFGSALGFLGWLRRSKR